MLKKIYSDAQITKIRDQSLAYVCACPAQVCVAIDNMRGLHSFESNCLDLNETDETVHLLVREVAERNHAALESCLSTIMDLEGWDMDTLAMPVTLKEKMFGGAHSPRE